MRAGITGDESDHARVAEQRPNDKTPDRPLRLRHSLPADGRCAARRLSAGRGWLERARGHWPGNPDACEKVPCESRRPGVACSAMRAVCAWCGTIIAKGDPGDTQVSHGICSQCAPRFFPAGFRYAVVPPDRSFLLPEIEGAFRTVRGIRIILDRRRGERRRRPSWVRDDRRVPLGDRRQSPSPIVGALPTVAGLSLLLGGAMALGPSGDSPRPHEQTAPQRPQLHPSPLPEGP